MHYPLLALFRQYLVLVYVRRPSALAWSARYQLHPDDASCLVCQFPLGCEGTVAIGRFFCQCMCLSNTRPVVSPVSPVSRLTQSRNWICIHYCLLLIFPLPPVHPPQSQWPLSTLRKSKYISEAGFAQIRMMVRTFGFLNIKTSNVKLKLKQI